MDDHQEFQDNLQEEFLVQAREYVEKIEEDLISLERRPDGDNSELIADVFRAIHSIKGAAGFMGFPKIAELSHVMETMLQMMRSGGIRPEPRFIDALLSGLDTLRILLDDLGRSNDIDIAPVRERLSDLTRGASSPEIRKDMDTRVCLSGISGQPADFEINRFMLNNILLTHNHLYILTYNLHEIQNLQGITPLSLSRRLLKEGLIVDTKLETGAVSLDQDLTAMPLNYLVLYAANLDLEKVGDTACLNKSRITQVDTSECGPGVIQKPVPIPASLQKEDISVRPEPSEPSRRVEKKEVESPGQDQVFPKESHETETIRVKVDVLDRLMELAGELVLVRNQQILSLEKYDSSLRRISRRLDMVTSELQETIMRTRMQPLGNIFAKLPRIVRDLSAKLNKPIEISISGSEVELDKTILESLNDPLLHIIRNCCDHGIESPEQRKKAEKSETGMILVEACHEAGQISIRIKDDGRGIDPEKIRTKVVEKGFKSEAEISLMGDKEILSLVLMSGFSTSNGLSEVSGRGVGMDVVKTAADHLGGSVEIESAVGKGTTIHLRLPLTLAIIPCLIVTVGRHSYVIPQVNLVELVCLYDQDAYDRIEDADDQEVFRLRDQLLPMVRLSEVLKSPHPFTREDRRRITAAYAQMGREGGLRTSDSLNFAVVKFGTHKYGLIMDMVIGTEEIVVKPMHSMVKSLGIYSGATVMGDGRVSLILDIEGIARHAGIPFSTLEDDTDSEIRARSDKQTVLLFKNGDREQFAVSLPLVRRIERISASSIEQVGKKRFITINGISTLVLRLDELMDVSPYVEKQDPFLLMPKHIKRPFGILISSILDITDAPVNLSTDTYMADGLLGTAIIREKMSLFLDIYRLIELADPNWFAERRKASPPPKERKRVLLVEDVPFFRQLVKNYLEADNYEVVTAEHGKAGLDLMNRNTFDLIVSDLEMPVMNGWEYLKNVRKESRWCSIPAVALTALDSPQDRELAMTAGFNAYEIKIDREQLLSTIAGLLRWT
jgi:two-component system chemotaxis sensor kinase CheA